MAMNKDILGTAINNALNSGLTGIAPESPTYSITTWKIIADEIIKHIQNNMQVTVDIPVTNNNPDIVGSNAGGPVTFTNYGTNPATTINVTGPTKIV